MEHISIKLDGNFLKDVEDIIRKGRYSTKSQFIREAMRDKIDEIKKKAMLEHIEKIAGKSKRKTTDAQLHAMGEKVFEELARKHGIKLKN